MKAEKSIPILLVDDDPKNLMVLETILNVAEYHLVKASTADAALLALMQEDFAAIVLDVRMPDLSGIELARLIKQRRKTQHVPILFLTAYDQDEEQVVQGYGVGAVDFITKPVNPAVLRSKIAVFVDLFQKTAALAQVNQALEAEIAEKQKAESALVAANIELQQKHAELLRQSDERVRRLRAEVAAAEAEAARERSALLSEAGSIVARSLDADEILRQLARLAIEKLAECCMIDLLQEDGGTKLMEFASRDELYRELCSRLAQMRGRRAAVVEVIRTRRVGRWDRGEPERLPELIDRPEDLTALRDAGFLDLVIAPLEARGRVLGTLSLLSRPGNTFTRSEITLIEELASRAALGLDNARLFQEAARARETAEAANSAKDRFLAMLSHELRTPLSPVLHAVALLKEEGSCPPALHETLDVIRRNVQLEARLIDDLLDLARIRNGKLQLAVESVDAHELLRQAIEICRPELVTSGLQCVSEFRAEQSWIEADPARIQQIFWNLLSNAIKFTPPSGRITVTTENDRATGALRIELTDSGIGLAPDQIGRIFDAFEQAHDRRSTGLGLGLAICRALTELHKGQIAARSGGIGRGSTFSIQLPLATRKPSSPAIPVREEPDASQSRLRLLIVEDHRDTAVTLEKLLVRRGYFVKSCGSIADAQALIDETELDVLVSDIGLPDGSGLDLMPKFLSASGQRKVCAIALSGFGMPEDVERSREAGFDEHLTKPVDISLLHQMLIRFDQRIRTSPAAAGSNQSVAAKGAN